ncbi:hypothetical protein DCCM_3962 [Desulfocucumis palustris]|uniref:Uncharacterized protein n=1 Tax=Desulfocucumis palustris TaxID=1898651 RepID=A0A2L2XFD9_9FIRM|nr:hypothetical protein DCCM_3962 [Desulfocucumis palustris]
MLFVNTFKHDNPSIILKFIESILGIIFSKVTCVNIMPHGRALKY